jgi:signal transduction histidine kinase
VFCFGLVHGLGFASALGIDRAWSWTLLSSLFVFNVGIELVQLGIILAVFPVLALLRRRAPVAIGLVLAAAAAGCATAGVANYVALFAVARTRRIELAFAVAFADVAGALGFWLLYPANSELSLTVVVNTAIALAVVAWGALHQKQQDLVAVYRDRAARIERERELRAEQLQLAERARIARDMHDSVAHYMSLIALYAGGLEVAGANAKDVGGTATTNRTTATKALDELRTVIGVLRDGTLAVPQKTPHERTVRGLVDEARQAGQLVVAHLDDEALRAANPATEEAYRLVQEGLTNARKHAAGSLVTVRVRRDGPDLLVTVTNPVDPNAPTLPGGGAGLLGLAERVTALGGTVEHDLIGRGDGGAGEFRMHGRVPYR